MTELYRSRFFVWSGDRAKIVGSLTPFYGFLDRAYERMGNDFGIRNLTDQKLPISVVVQPSESCRGGIGGSASEGGLGFCAGQWIENHWCYGLLVQELCNWMTGQVSGGWPSAWWANGRSPFPVMMSVVLLRLLDKNSLAEIRDTHFKSDAWYDHFKRLHERYGFRLWRVLFGMLIDLHVDLSKIEEPHKTALVMAMIAFFTRVADAQ